MQTTVQTPILFLIFNRPDETKKVFEAIRQAQPSQLFIAADGARPERSEEAEICQRTRAVVKNIDWDCKVNTLFRDTNLGCKYAVSGAINWFFSNVSEGIILEDDIVPDPSFFKFCEILLEKYRHDTRIMQICGANFQFGRQRGDGGYYFSRYNHVWGWATWKRAWQLYDVDIKTFPAFKQQRCIETIFYDPIIQQYWTRAFERMYRKEIDTWDYQWTYAIWCNNGLSIIPNINLVSNIGFGQNATHTTDSSAVEANHPTYPMKEIIHPTFVLLNNEADDYTSARLYLSNKKLIAKIKRYIKRVLWLIARG